MYIKFINILLTVSFPFSFLSVSFPISLLFLPFPLPFLSHSFTFPISFPILSLFRSSSFQPSPYILSSKLQTHKPHAQGRARRVEGKEEENKRIGKRKEGSGKEREGKGKGKGRETLLLIACLCTCTPAENKQKTKHLSKPLELNSHTQNCGLN